MLGTTDWLLKRFLKFVLKRNVGKYLCSEIDLEQLDVKLDAGKLELKNLLLNCEAINKDLVSLSRPFRGHATQCSAVCHVVAGISAQRLPLPFCAPLVERSSQYSNPRRLAHPSQGIDALGGEAAYAEQGLS